MGLDPQVPVVEVGEELGAWIVESAELRLQRNHTLTEDNPDPPHCWQ